MCDNCLTPQQTCDHKASRQQIRHFCRKVKDLLREVKDLDVSYVHVPTQRLHWQHPIVLVKDPSSADFYRQSLLFSVTGPRRVSGRVTHEVNNDCGLRPLPGDDEVFPELGSVAGNRCVPHSTDQW